MELYFHLSSLRRKPQDRGAGLRAIFPSSSLRNIGEAGEVILPLLLSLVLGGFLMTSLVWLNEHYKKKTKEHLSDFEQRWNHLDKKYKN